MNCRGEGLGQRTTASSLVPSPPRPPRTRPPGSVDRALDASPEQAHKVWMSWLEPLRGGPLQRPNSCCPELPSRLAQSVCCGGERLGPPCAAVIAWVPLPHPLTSVAEVWSLTDSSCQRFRGRRRPHVWPFPASASARCLTCGIPPPQKPVAWALMVSQRSTGCGRYAHVLLVVCEHYCPPARAVSGTCLSCDGRWRLQEGREVREGGRPNARSGRPNLFRARPNAARPFPTNGLTASDGTKSGFALASRPAFWGMTAACWTRTWLPSPRRGCLRRGHVADAGSTVTRSWTFGCCCSCCHWCWLWLLSLLRYLAAAAQPGMSLKTDRRAVPRG